MQALLTQLISLSPPSIPHTPHLLRQLQTLLQPRHRPLAQRHARVGRYAAGRPVFIAVHAAAGVLLSPIQASRQPSRARTFGREVLLWRPRRVRSVDCAAGARCARSKCGQSKAWRVKFAPGGLVAGLTGGSATCSLRCLLWVVNSTSRALT
eukprot:196703-Chlamydomonas_euryale.AAC.3